MSAGEGDGSISGSAGPSGAASTETACSSVAQQQPDSSSSSTTTTSSSPSSTDSGTTSAATTTPATTTTGSGSGGGAGSAASSQPTPTATTTTTTTTTTITTATTASGGGAVSARESGAGAGAGTGAGAGGGGGGVVVMSEVVKEFRAATRADEHQAIEYIEMSNGNLLAALAKFFDDETQKLLGGRKTPMRQEDPPSTSVRASTGARPAPPLLPPSSQLVELPLDEIPKQPLTPKADQPTPKAEQLTPKEEHRTPKERETEPPTEQEPAHLEVAEKISVTLGECVLPAYSSTVGAEFMLVQPNTQGLQSFKIQFWDTAGIEKYRSLASTYYRSSSAVIVVYSCTDRVSFDHASKWLIEAKEHLRDAIIVLVGSKIDLVSERKVSTLEGEALATAFSIPFHEVSASSGENVPRFLKEIIQCIYLKGYSSNCYSHKVVVVGDSQAGKSALTLRIKTCTVDVSVLAACLQTEAGGLGNSPLPRVQKTLFPAVVVIPRLPMLNPIDKLASLQLTDGSWILSDELAAVIGQSIRILDDNTPQSPPSLAIIKHAWPTCLVLAYLEKEHSHHKSDWQSLSLRANRWIDRTVPANNVDKITNAARTMLGSRD